MRRVKHRVAGVVAAVVVLIVAAGCVQGPITTGTPAALGSSFDLSQIGYQRSEHYLTGFAQSYALTAPIPTDGELQVAAQPQVESGVYRTRLVVFRPVDPAKFNGTVVVEWLNVSAGSDVAADWSMVHNELVRDGAAYVGVSAQAVGVNALKTSGNPRYSTLTHPGDSYSYDIFTQAGRSVRDQAATVLGGLTPTHVIAAGESQSASRMVTYIDAVQPLAHVFDGFMVHSRSGSGSAISQAPLPAVAFPAPAPIRDDLDVPVMVVEAEGDVINSNLLARQPDTAKFREWEMTGTSHADAYTITVGTSDTGDGRGAVKMLNFMKTPLDAGCGSPVNAGPHHWILQAAFHHLDVWVRTGVAPPAGPPLQVASTSPTVLVRDANGNALGGIRSPQVDAPIATLLGTNTGAGFCLLFGTTIPFTPTQLQALYPTHADFVNQWLNSVYANVALGYLMPADGAELASAAASSSIPN
jgi:Alpha/beta hydrolase domain